MGISLGDMFCRMRLLRRAPAGTTSAESVLRNRRKSLQMDWSNSQLVVSSCSIWSIDCGMTCRKPPAPLPDCYATGFYNLSCRTLRRTYRYEAMVMEALGEMLFRQSSLVSF